jgi:hypothetical protein
MSDSKNKQLDIDVTAEMIDGAERDVVGRCMVAEALKAIPGITRPSVDMQTIRFTRDGERETYFTPWDVQNAIVRFDGGDPVEPFNFRLIFRNRVLLQRRLTDNESKPTLSARSRAEYAAKRAKEVAADPDASKVKKARAKAKAAEAKAEYETIRAARGPIKHPTDRPISRQTTDTELGVVAQIKQVRYPNLARTSQRKFGQRIMRANQPDARVDRGFTD